MPAHLKPKRRPVQLSDPVDQSLDPLPTPEEDLYKCNLGIIETECRKY